MEKSTTNIAIFASGNGSNAQAILECFNEDNSVNITCIYSNNKDAYVLKRAKHFGVVTRTFNREEFYKSAVIFEHLQKNKTNLIILAGFMWLVPNQLVDSFTILNIHPALLPKYGGKGMYGNFVHEAVIKNKETESGITIHYVNNEYDKGDIVFQAKCAVSASDSPEDLAATIHKLEHKYYPQTILQVVKKLQS